MPAFSQKRTWPGPSLFDACPNVARVCEKERGREISIQLNEYDKLW